MKKCIGKVICATSIALPLALSLGGCGGGSGGGTTSTGAQASAVSVALTDAPNTSFTHVWVTVKEVWFHTSNVAATGDPGWIKFPLKDASGNPTAATVDLAALANGAAPNTVWSGLTLPLGNYQQIRIFLADTDNEALTIKLPTGVIYNNEVDYLDNTGTPQQAPLEIPASDDGISVIPETPIVVTATSNNKLVLDFNLNEDVVGPLTSKGTTEFILKPRLKYYDMNQAGTITGTIASNGGFNFVVKAEQLYSNRANASDPNNGHFYVVKRDTGIPQPGKFTIAPVPIFGNATTASFDVLMRGRGVQTCIAQGVTVHKGAITDLGTIAMASAPEYTAQLQTAYHPTGAWINFYQSVNGSKPYEVRVRHLDPYTGKLFQSMELSTGPIGVAPWQSGVPLAFQSVVPDQGAGTFWTAPGAEMYSRVIPSAAYSISGTAGQVDNPFTTAVLTALPNESSNSITASFTFSQRMLKFLPTKGQIFATHGGLIVDTIGTLTGDTTVGTAMSNGGGTGNPITLSNLPGGSVSSPLQGAFYGLYAAGWGGGRISLGSVHGIDLRTGSQGSAGSPISILMH